MWLQFVSRTPQAAPKNASSGPDWDKYPSLADMAAVRDQILWVFLSSRLSQHFLSQQWNTRHRIDSDDLRSGGCKSVTRVRRCLRLKPSPEPRSSRLRPLLGFCFFSFLWRVLVAKRQNAFCKFPVGQIWPQILARSKKEDTMQNLGGLGIK